MLQNRAVHRTLLQVQFISYVVQLEANLFYLTLPNLKKLASSRCGNSLCPVLSNAVVAAHNSAN